MGQDLLAVDRDGGSALLYPLLARELSRRLGVAGDDLPAGDELQEMARRYLTTAGDVQDIYREIRIVLRELEPLSIPTPLAQLAGVLELRLFVTTTFDFMMERAVNARRYDGQRQTLVFSYAPNDKQDLPREFDQLHRPTVYQLMGRFSSTPHSYAVTQEDTLRFIQSLQAKTEDSPQFLFDRLKHGNLLIIGSHIADWLASFFIRGASGSRHVEIPIDLDIGGDTRGSVLFLERFSGGTRIYRGRGAVGFVDELCRRWHDEPTSGESQPPPAVRGFQSGAVYVSYASADTRQAESIRDALDSDGVDVVFDNDDVPVADKWEKKLRGYVAECAVFIPIVSKRAIDAQRRFFQREWVEAILEAGKTVPSGRFILPVVVDAAAPSERALPEEFGKLDYERWTSNQPNSKLVETVVQLQRDYRSASFA